MRITTFFKKIIGLLATIVESVSTGKDNTITIDVRPRWRKPRCGKCGKKADRLHGKRENSEPGGIWESGEILSGCDAEFFELNAHDAV